MPKPAVRESPKQMMRSCADGEGLCVVGWAGGLGAGVRVVVDSVLVLAGLQPVRHRLAAREAKATKAIPDKLGDTRAWVTDLF